MSSKIISSTNYVPKGTTGEFISCTRLEIAIGSIFQKISLVMSQSILPFFLVVFLNLEGYKHTTDQNSEEKYLDGSEFSSEIPGSWPFPTLDGPTMYPIWQNLSFLDNEFIAKITINIGLIQIWYCQHLIMSKRFFKAAIFNALGKKYALIERPMFNYLSSMILLIIMYFWQNDDRILQDLTTLSNFGWFLIGSALALFSGVLVDYFISGVDIFGSFIYWEQVTWTGFRFPLEERFVKINRFNLMMRHGIYASLLGFFGGALFTNPITVGRLSLAGSFQCFTVIGTFAEEFDSSKCKGYDIYLQLHNTRWLPNLTTWFMNEKDLEYKRSQL